MSTKVSTAVRPLWSATPTPFDDHLELDMESLRRLLEHHITQQVDGVFLAGTCGEGPWMTDRQRADLLGASRDIVGPDYPLAFQVTDQSAARTLDQIETAQRLGATLAVVAQPALFMNPTEQRTRAFYIDILERTPLDVCFYNRGGSAGFPLSPGAIEEICMHPRVKLIKDSSPRAEENAATLAARARRPDLVLMTGNEFKCMEALLAGVDGLMLGGAVLSAPLLRRLLVTFDAGALEEARKLDRQAVRILLGAYGGEGFPCWLSGLKYALCVLGVFSNTASYLEYPLTDDCRASAEAAMRELSPMFIAA